RHESRRVLALANLGSSRSNGRRRALRSGFAKPLSGRRANRAAHRAAHGLTGRLSWAAGSGSLPRLRRANHTVRFCPGPRSKSEVTRYGSGARGGPLDTSPASPVTCDQGFVRYTWAETYWASTGLSPNWGTAGWPTCSWRSPKVPRGSAFASSL